MICGFAWLAGRWTGDVDMAMVGACIHTSTYVLAVYGAERASSAGGPNPRFRALIKPNVVPLKNPQFFRSASTQCKAVSATHKRPAEEMHLAERANLRISMERTKAVHAPTNSLVASFFWGGGSPFWFLAH
jgi:hypothetical protein